MQLIAELHSLKERLNYIYGNPDLRDFRKYFFKPKNTLKTDDKQSKEAFVSEFVANINKK